MEREKEKDINLLNIYIRIHNKQTLTLDDLAYLAKYNPTCFKKTCDNLIYELPEAKALVKPFESLSDPASFPKPVSKSVSRTMAGTTPEKRRQTVAGAENHSPDPAGGKKPQDEQAMIHHIIENLRGIEAGEIETMQSIDVTEVKGLLGGLFMESLFPHSGAPEYFDICKEENGTLFNARV